MTIDLTQFHAAFYEESLEALGSMEHNLLQLDVGAPEPELINTIFRVAHSIKGGAATFGFAEITSFTHTLETVLDALRAQRLPINLPLIDLLLHSVDLLREMLRAQQASEPVDAQRITDLQFDLEVAVVRNGAVPAPPADRAPAATTTAVAAASGSADAPAHEEHGRNPLDATRGADGGSIRVNIDKIDLLMNGVGELVITQSMLGQFGVAVSGIEGERLRAALAQLERNVRELQESVMRVRMVPISFVFSRFPRMVRDLSRRLGKQIALQITGGDTELDKTVLEKIGDPLVHLVRNCLDHGIEMPDARVAAGKPAAGSVRLHACHHGSSIQVEVSDDGSGLKRERILARARASGLLALDTTPGEEEIDGLIFAAGFTTAEHTTDVSGRGVGLDVVRRNVEGLGGSIEVRSEAGKGARFTISLPLTLAIVDGQTVAVGEETYIVPLTAIVESLQLRFASINRLGASGELLHFRGEYLPLLRLDEILHGRRQERRADDAGLVMVVEGDGRRVGLCVDGLLEQQQVVVKALEDNYGHVDGIAGATILGDGAVALILDVAGLTRTAAGRAAA
jgi:two-component system chemotaxis sensor kinase CheA